MTDIDDDYCRSCEGGEMKIPLDGDTPRGMLCCDVCYQCEVCGCSCDETFLAETKADRKEVMEVFDRCWCCRSIQPKPGDQSIHLEDCPNHDENTCLVCASNEH